MRKISVLLPLMVLTTATTFARMKIQNTQLPTGVVSQSYSASLDATGGAFPYVWKIIHCSGACNSGLRFNSLGVLYGTPANAGSSTFTFGATDARGRRALATLTLTITASAPAPPAPVPVPAPDRPLSISPVHEQARRNIYYVSPDGDNSNPCAQSSPCAMPDYAFNLASAGDTVQVAPGIYDYGSSAAEFRKSGTAGNYITVTCATRGACTIQNSVAGNRTVVLLAGSYITFDGFEVTNTSNAGNNLGLYVTSSFVNITRNAIHHIETDCSDMGGGGIVIAGGGDVNYGITNIVIDSNLIYDINYSGGSPSCGTSTVQSDGILVETSGDSNSVTNNIIYNTSGGWGIVVGNSNATSSPTIPAVISNNLVFSSAGGITVTSGRDTLVTNNIVLDNGLTTGRCGMNAPPGTSITYANNDIFGNPGGAYCIEWGEPGNQSVHSNDISADPSLGPTFVNWQEDGSGDYHEKAGSPTIDAGSSIGTPPSHDYDGNIRPQGPGSGYDIGPYEYTDSGIFDNSMPW